MSSRIHQHLLTRRDAILQSLLQELRRRNGAPDQPRTSVLLDAFPEFLEELALAVGHQAGSLPDHRLPTAADHGAQRWQNGFDLRSVVREYGLLLHVIMKDLEAYGQDILLSDVDALANAVNAGIADAVSAFTEQADTVRTTLTETEGELSANEARLRVLTESIPQIVFTAKRDGSIDWHNQRGFAYTGATLGASGAWSFFDALHPDDRAATLERYTQALARRETFELEFRLRRHDGAYRWFLARATPIARRGSEEVDWFGTCTDIDDQKQTEARLRTATEEGEQLNRLKDEFLAAVSHELRTPLQAMLGWARLLRLGQVPEERRQKALETIERNAQAQSVLIEDILDLSRIITGKERLRTATLDPAAIFRATVDGALPAAHAKQVKLDLALKGVLGTMRGDADRLRQVVWNLLNNAIKFTPPGGHVRVSAERGDGVLVLRVVDDGQGIDPQFLPFVFHRFQQGSAESYGSHGGLGLGLAIVHHIVELHGGTVAVHSEGEGRGSQFEVRLPLGLAPGGPSEPPAQKAGSNPGLPSARALSGVSVLVVDDHADGRELLRAMLEQYGARVREASGTREAIAFLETERFDVLVSDLGMPQEDGLALIRRVRGSSSEFATIPAIALTAYARATDGQRAHESGYDHHVAKPVELARIIAAVARLARPKS
jgi:hypothetical protein